MVTVGIGDAEAIQDGKGVTVTQGNENMKFEVESMHQDEDMGDMIASNRALINEDLKGELKKTEEIG